MDRHDDILVFNINGEKFELPDLDPSTTLLDFIRSRTPFKSPKLGCGEGGCGACVVLVSKYDSILKKIESFSIPSCLTLLSSLHGASITTSEGLGNSQNGFHPIHHRLSGFHASQCGFCTPGMSISLFSALANADNINNSDHHRPQPPPGFSNLTLSEAEKSISGNLCRCTGYRPIADSCKSFAADVDLEDLGFNCFWNKGDSTESKLSRLPPYNPADHTFPYTGESKSSDTCSKRVKPIRFYYSKSSWYAPASIDELQTLLHSNNDTKFKVVVGNTGTGYYKDFSNYDVYIDLSFIPELSLMKKDESGIEFGAVLSIAKAISHLKESRNLVFAKIARHMDKIATPFVRNAGSIGGNLVMVQKNGFPSDIATLLLAVDASVNILKGRERRRLSVGEFLRLPPLGSKDILLSVQIPFLEPANSRLAFETYRAAPRPLGNALSYMRAAFLADISGHKNATSVNSINLAFGTMRATKVEEYLTGKVITVEVIKEAIKLVKQDVAFKESTRHSTYQLSLAAAFLFKFLSSFSTITSQKEQSNGCMLVGTGKRNHDRKILQTERISSLPLLSPGKQVLASSHEYYPVGQPIPKSGVAIQASGEAVYVDDIPSPPDCLHGAFVYSTKPLARVKAVSFNDSELSEITSVITSKDIPKGGENMGGMYVWGPNPLFADEIVRCAGDLIALVVAKSRNSAIRAAKNALVDYDTEGLDPPILTVEEAVEQSSFFDIPPFLCPEEVGDFLKGMAEAEHRIISTEMRLGSQYYFYMEPQTALAIPDEDNCMVVYTSSQSPEYSHRTIAKCLGIPDHNVRVLTRRVGGGFGGKALKSMPIAAACALAAHKLRRPVRMYLDRKTDMVIAGGRHPMKITYSVGFKSDGKVTALRLDILIDAGMSEDTSPIMPVTFIGSLKKYNWGALSFDVKVCKTNRISRSAMRAPGNVQGSFIAEAIIEHIASVLSIDVDAVRTRNLHSYETLSSFYLSAGEVTEFTLPSIWNKLAVSSDFESRALEINQFNRSNVWRKRGISRVPTVFEVQVLKAPGKVSILWDGSIVVEVGGIEIGQGLWTKVKQVAAYELSLIQCEGCENLVDKIRVLQADTLSLVQGEMTGGSTTSESSCAAVRICCSVLVDRLRMVKGKQESPMTWDELILQANNQDVCLAANSLFVPDSSSAHYLNYGAAVSEVEIDILTGETIVLRTDILYDCGQSMNPAVDMGQIEGSFVQGLGFFMQEEYLFDSDGLAAVDGTWNYKIPTIDTIPKQFNVEILNSGHHKKRVLSSKASGEPPLVLAASVHCATKAAIAEARKQLKSWGASQGMDPVFHLDVPATMPVVKQLCGLDAVETYLKTLA